ncbi:MAG: nitrous oxide reductase accessory protein NosL [Saprospiraceae bacterium]|nr:nitrous oxide reductase accessory protein NosL [Saprospiraceae bacterium]
MKHMTYILFVVIGMVTTSCNVEPEPINYNYDECAYCKMKIADIRFGAEIVTSKGKIYKYDSAECLVRTYIESEKKDFAFVIVTDYAQPHNLIDAEDAAFLISEKQPSPMGGNLSAYSNQEIAQQTLLEKGGKVLSFSQLINEYINIYQ